MTELTTPRSPDREAEGYLAVYLTWLDACDRVAAAWEEWREAPSRKRAVAAAEFEQALDAEERAAALLEERARTPPAPRIRAA